MNPYIRPWSEIELAQMRAIQRARERAKLEPSARKVRRLGYGMLALAGLALFFGRPIDVVMTAAFGLGCVVLARRAS